MAKATKRKVNRARGNNLKKTVRRGRKLNRAVNHVKATKKRRKSRSRRTSRKVRKSLNQSGGKAGSAAMAKALFNQIILGSNSAVSADMEPYNKISKLNGIANTEDLRNVLNKDEKDKDFIIFFNYRLNKAIKFRHYKPRCGAPSLKVYEYKGGESGVFAYQLKNTGEAPVAEYLVTLDEDITKTKPAVRKINKRESLEEIMNTIDVNIDNLDIIVNSPTAILNEAEKGPAVPARSTTNKKFFLTEKGEIQVMDIFGTAPSVDAGGYAIPRPLNEASKQVEIERALKVEEKTILANEADRDEDAKDTDDGKDCPVQASAEGPEYEYGTPQEEKKAIERLQGKDVPQGEDVPQGPKKLTIFEVAGDEIPQDFKGKKYIVPFEEEGKETNVLLINETGNKAFIIPIIPNISKESKTEPVTFSKIDREGNLITGEETYTFVVTSGSVDA